MLILGYHCIKNVGCSSQMQHIKYSKKRAKVLIVSKYFWMYLKIIFLKVSENKDLIFIKFLNIWKKIKKM